MKRVKCSFADNLNIKRVNLNMKRELVHTQ